MDLRVWLLALLALFTVFHLVTLVAGAKAAPAAQPTPWTLGTGFVTNFFDTLGIGSFATTTTIFRARKLVSDDLIPGTLNVGHTLPVIAQAFIYTSIVDVDGLTLVGMIIASIVGAW